MHTHPRHHHAFSLVELSIVLVILGLLTGGVLAGQSLIKAAELRSIGTEYSRYATAAKTFRDKYSALPGDMSNATDFWGAIASCPASGTSNPSGTCNGNGDGMIGPSTSAIDVEERFRFWHHLVLASLIEGNYSGTSVDQEATAQNVPTSKLQNGLWYAINRLFTNSSATWFPGDDYGNTFYFGGQLANLGPITGILAPSDAWSVDKKMDDGRPSTGSVMAINRSTCTDAVSVGNDNASYLLAISDKTCGLIFPRAY